MADTSTKLSTGIRQVLVPDIGNFKEVDVIEVAAKPGDSINAEDTLITLETDKATMDVPAPFAGVLKELKVKVGDKVSQGSLIALVETSHEAAPAGESKQTSQPSSPPVEAGPARDQANRGQGPLLQSSRQAIDVSSIVAGSIAHASPAIRRFARELGVDLAQVQGSAAKGRVTREDVQQYVKAQLAAPRGGSGGLQVAEMPVVDFSQFGAVETLPLSRIKKLSGAYLHRNWVSIPHVTQHDEADITELEAWRKELNAEFAAQGVKITPLAFLIRAAVETLMQFPEFNASLDAGGENLVLKKYFHIGVAVDTPEGLVVPVIRDVNRKGLLQLAQELAETSQRARDKKLSAAEMQGGCFTLSSLGGIGGSFFTPIINAPEVAILGVSRSTMKPVWKDGAFTPRLMLPLSLSYDHRVIDGAAGARFIVHLGQTLADVRRLAL